MDVFVVIFAVEAARAIAQNIPCPAVLGALLVYVMADQVAVAVSGGGAVAVVGLTKKILCTSKKISQSMFGFRNLLH